MKNIITERKNTLEQINRRLDDTEEQIGKLEHRVMEISEAEKNRIKRNEDSLRDFWTLWIDARLMDQMVILFLVS